VKTVWLKRLIKLHFFWRFFILKDELAHELIFVSGAEDFIRCLIIWLQFNNFIILSRSLGSAKDF